MNEWKRPKKVGRKLSESLSGNQLDVEFSEERADEQDWEALERSDRADERQNQKSSSKF